VIALLLIGGFVFSAAVGYFALGRLGRFLDEGGVSPYWDWEEERAVRPEKKKPVQTVSPKQKKSCCASHVNIL